MLCLIVVLMGDSVKYIYEGCRNKCLYFYVDENDDEVHQHNIDILCFLLLSQHNLYQLLLLWQTFIQLKLEKILPQTNTNQKRRNFLGSPAYWLYL